MKNDKPFLTITNQKIYDKIIEIDDKNRQEHLEIIKRLDVSNGKLKKSLLIAGAALGLTVLLAGWFIQHLLNSIPK